MSTAQKFSGQQSGKFAFNLGTITYAGIAKNISQDWSADDQVSLWVKPDDSRQQLVVQFKAGGVVYEGYHTLAGTDPATAPPTEPRDPGGSGTGSGSGTTLTGGAVDSERLAVTGVEAGSIVGAVDELLRDRAVELESDAVFASIEWCERWSFDRGGAAVGDNETFDQNAQCPTEGADTDCARRLGAFHLRDGAGRYRQSTRKLPVYSYSYTSVLSAALRRFEREDERTRHLTEIVRAIRLRDRC